MEEGINRVMHLAACEGVECEVYGEATRRFKVEVYRGKLESLDRSRDAGIGVRVVRERRVGYAYSSNLKSSGLDAVFNEAKENASRSSQMKVDVLADNYGYVGEKEIYPKLPPEDENSLKVEGVKEMEQACFDYDSAVVNTEGAAYYEVVGEVAVASTRGFFRRERRGLCSCSIASVARRGGEVRSGWYYGQALDPRDMDFRDVGRRAAEMSVSLLGSKRIATGRYPVVLGESAFTDIVGLFEQALSADRVVKGTSVLAGKLGESVAPEFVNIVDDPFMEGGCYNASFDAEGVPRKRCVLIESGVLKGYFHNMYSARMMGLPPTANAVRSSFKNLPVPGPTNLYLHPGKREALEMVADLKEGVYVQDIMGIHTADSISGDFSVGINGFYIRCGAISNPICEITMSGNILDVLHGIREVGRNVVFIGSYGSPAVLVEGLSISGT